MAVSDSCIAPNRSQLSLRTDFKVVNQTRAAQFCSGQYHQWFSGADLFRAGSQQISLTAQRNIIHIPATRVQGLDGLPFQSLNICAACQNIGRSEEHTSELQSLMRISYAVFCLKKKKHIITKSIYTHTDSYRQTHNTQ